MKIDDIGIWEAFAAVAKSGNFSKASRVLRITVSQLSKRVARLEAELGVRLFHRTTRVVTLTDEGKALLPKVTSVLEDIGGIESYFETDQKISGTIRITCIPFVAQRLLIPVLEEFEKLYPDVRVEIDLSEGIVNLIESGFDIAIRIQEPSDSSLVYKKLVTNDLIFCASPAYLKSTRNPLTKPGHLSGHKLLSLSLHRRCEFRDGSASLSDFSGARSITCENGWYLTELALRGFGVLVRSIWDVREYLKSGDLVQVLPDYPLRPFGNIYAVVPSRRYLAPRVRVFLDLLVSRAARWSEIKADT